MYEIKINAKLESDEILILPVKYVINVSGIDMYECSDNYDRKKIYTLLNKSGWKISAKIKADYYTWIEYFIAKHEKYGVVYGNFNDTIYATSEEAYSHFITNHPIHVKKFVSEKYRLHV